MIFRKLFSHVFRTSRKFLNCPSRDYCENANKCKRIILDFDVGTDDAVALFLLLYGELKKLVKIEMIVCSRGNTSRQNVIRNTIRLLELANRTDIPVYLGSFETFMPVDFDEYFHGVDGFGDLEYDREPDLSVIKKEPAIIASRDLIRNNPKEISLVALGPLTNVALLLRMYNDVACHIKDMYIMGGNHLGVGNVTQSAEFNFYMDPEAAHVVLTCAQCPLNFLTWETGLKTNISTDWRFKCVGETGGPTWQLITRAEKVIYKKQSAWTPCDAFTVAAMMYPELIQKQMCRHLGIEMAGRVTRGQMVVDNINLQEPNANLIQQIDSEGFKQLVVDCHTLF